MNRVAQYELFCSNHYPAKSDEMKILIQLFCVSVFLITTGYTQKPEELKKLRFRFEVAIAEERKPLNEFEKQYRVQLQKLEGRIQAAGDLKKLLTVREELKSFDSGNAKDFPELERLQGIYKKERDTIVSKISETEKRVIGAYQKKLSELQKKLTQEGKIDDAVKVAAEIEKMKLRGIAVASLTKPVMKAGLSSAPASATIEKSFENSLGMSFVPVPITGGPTEGQKVLFSIWETRVGDYEAFIKKNRKREWKKISFKQKDDHPAVNMNWNDAVEFCVWLTELEQEKGILGENERYRLPSDYEWSCAVGFGDKEKPEESPKDKVGKFADIYPWGKDWPPPSGAGNYCGEETKVINARPPIAGYADDFLRTASVGSFAPNEFGLFDLNGNVWEWCEDWLGLSGNLCKWHMKNTKTICLTNQEKRKLRNQN